MAAHRMNKINQQLAQEMAQITRDVKDPRVSGTLLTITGAQCTPDLKYAKIYFSTVGGKEESEKARRGLISATGFIRFQLAQRLNLRITPELTFVIDESAQNASHISELLHSVEDELNDFERREAEQEAQEMQSGDGNND